MIRARKTSSKTAVQNGRNFHMPNVQDKTPSFLVRVYSTFFFFPTFPRVKKACVLLSRSSTRVVKNLSNQVFVSQNTQVYIFGGTKTKRGKEKNVWKYKSNPLYGKGRRVPQNHGSPPFEHQMTKYGKPWVPGNAQRFFLSFFFLSLTPFEFWSGRELVYYAFLEPWFASKN